MYSFKYLLLLFLASAATAWSSPVFASYFITDVAAITKQPEDPDSDVSHDEYIMYRIVLNSKERFEVITYATNTANQIRTALFATGYSGNMADLLAQVKTLPPDVSLYMRGVSGALHGLIKAEARIETLGIVNKLSFYIDDELVNIDTTFPYYMSNVHTDKLDTTAWSDGQHYLKVEAEVDSETEIRKTDITISNATSSAVNTSTLTPGTSVQELILALLKEVVRLQTLLQAMRR